MKKKERTVTVENAAEQLRFIVSGDSNVVINLSNSSLAFLCENRSAVFPVLWNRNTFHLSVQANDIINLVRFLDDSTAQFIFTEKTITVRVERDGHTEELYMGDMSHTTRGGTPSII